MSWKRWAHSNCLTGTPNRSDGRWQSAPTHWPEATTHTVHTHRAQDTEEAASAFSEAASGLLLLPVGMTGFEPATP